MENQRRNNPSDMTATEMILKVKEEVCDKICKYRAPKYKGYLTQEDLEEICERECPLKKL